MNAYDARAAVLQSDPNRLTVRKATDLGRRMPAHFQTPSALAGMPSLTGAPLEDQHIYQNMNSDQVVNPAASVSGQRVTHWGTTGARLDGQGDHFDARKRFGYGEMGTRDAGFSAEWDNPTNQERTAGRLLTVTTFDQDVMPDRPYLHLRAGGTSVQAEGTYQGNAIITITAGNYQHGAQEVRRFWIGGGVIGAFDLRGWDNVRINVEEMLDDTYVEFAWTADGLAGPSRWLLYPEVYTTSASTIPVPQGAYALAVESPSPGVPTTATLSWTGRRAGNVPFTFTEIISDAGVSQVYWGKPIEVKAPTFRIASSVDILWFLRPI